MIQVGKLYQYVQHGLNPVVQLELNSVVQVKEYHPEKDMVIFNCADASDSNNQTGVENFKRSFELIPGQTVQIVEQAFKKSVTIQLKNAIENNKWEDLFSLAKDLGENCTMQLGMYNQAKAFELAGGNAQSQYARIRMWAMSILKKYQGE